MAIGPASFSGSLTVNCMAQGQETLKFSARLMMLTSYWGNIDFSETKLDLWVVIVG